jgi:hypothetical protein
MIRQEHSSQSEASGPATRDPNPGGTAGFAPELALISDTCYWSPIIENGPIADLNCDLGRFML